MFRVQMLHTWTITSVLNRYQHVYIRCISQSLRERQVEVSTIVLLPFSFISGAGNFVSTISPSMA